MAKKSETKTTQVKKRQSKKKASKKQAEVEAEAEAEAEAEVEAEAKIEAETTEVKKKVMDEKVEVELTTLFDELSVHLDTMKQSSIDAKKKARELQKICNRLDAFKKKVDKKAEKRKKSSGGSKGGIQAPRLVDDVLAEFIGIEKGSMVSRVEASKAVHAYANENKLKDGSKINLDETLQNVFGKSVKGPIVHTQIIKLLGHRFIKSKQ